MHTSTLIKTLVLSALTGCILPTASIAEDAHKIEKAEKPMPKKMLKKYDADQDGVLSDDEKAQMKKAKTEAWEAQLKKYDTDGDGKMSKDEKAEMKKAKNEAWEAKKAAKEKMKEEAGMKK